ncbi:hypothetical protein ATCC90586_007727 [Pythium insidiosum]|nr:hypothetical protein ATCC90586_007727 [Pythium insidiosum]
MDATAAYPQWPPLLVRTGLGGTIAAASPDCISLRPSLVNDPALRVRVGGVDAVGVLQSCHRNLAGYSYMRPFKRVRHKSHYTLNLLAASEIRNFNRRNMEFVPDEVLAEHVAEAIRSERTTPEIPPWQGCAIAGLDTGKQEQAVFFPTGEALQRACVYRHSRERRRRQVSNAVDCGPVIRQFEIMGSPETYALYSTGVFRAAARGSANCTIVEADLTKGVPHLRVVAALPFDDLLFHVAGSPHTEEEAAFVTRNGLVFTWQPPSGIEAISSQPASTRDPLQRCEYSSSAQLDRGLILSSTRGEKTISMHSFARFEERDVPSSLRITPLRRISEETMEAAPVEASQYVAADAPLDLHLSDGGESTSLIGMCALNDPHTDGGFVFQLNSMGDLYYQSIRPSGGCPTSDSAVQFNSAIMATKKAVLEEDEYVDKLERIIERDFFPDLHALREQSLRLDDAPAASTPAHRVTTSTTQPQNSRRQALDVSTRSSSSHWDQPTPPRRAAEHEDSADERREVPDRDGDAIDHPSTATRDMSLDAFVATHTTEDNAAFLELQEQTVKEHQQRYHWAYDVDERRGDPKLHLLRDGTWITKEQRLLADEALAPKGPRDDRPTAPDTWPFRARNPLLFAPEIETNRLISQGKTAPSGSSPLLLTSGASDSTPCVAVVAQSKQRLGRPPRGKRETVYANSRFPRGPEPSQTSINSTADSTPSRQTDSDRLMQMTPLIAPGVDASPLMTWGDIESTPMILDPRATPGGGPAGIGVFVRAARTGFLPRLLNPALHGTAKDLELSQRLDMVQKGVAIIHAGDESTFGSGNLGHYLINSNTFARSLLSSVLDEKPELDPPESIAGTFLERVRDQEATKRLEDTGLAPACLVDFGRFLNTVGTCLLDELATSHRDTCKALLQTRATKFELLPSGVIRVELTDSSADVLTMYTERLVLATGGRQEVPAAIESHSAYKAKLFLSDDCLRDDGFRRLRDHLLGGEGRKVCIVGGSHSAFSVAWLLLNRGKSSKLGSRPLAGSKSPSSTEEIRSADVAEATAPAEPSAPMPVEPTSVMVSSSGASPTKSPVRQSSSSTTRRLSVSPALSFQPKDITILHRSAIRCYYASRKEAETDGADASRVDRTGCVNTFTGLREDAKALFKDIKAGRETRVRLFQVNPRGSSNLATMAYDSAQAIVWAGGYSSCLVPGFDAQGNPLQYLEEHGVVKLDMHARLLLKTSEPSQNLMGVGLGFSLRSHVDEMGTETRADGVTVYHRRGATLVLAALFGPTVFGSEAQSFEEMVEKNDKRKKDSSASGSTPAKPDASLVDRVKRLSGVGPSGAPPTSKSPTKIPLTAAPRISPTKPMRAAPRVTMTASNNERAINPPVKLLLQRRRSAETLPTRRRSKQPPHAEKPEAEGCMSVPKSHCCSTPE